MWGTHTVSYDDGLNPADVDPPKRSGALADVGESNVALDRENLRQMPSDASCGNVVAAYSGSASRVGRSALVTLSVADGQRRVTVDTIAC